jgi:hypothetical protein
MQFFQQDKERNCQIVVLQTVLSYYNLFPTQKEIVKELPKHTFGNLITELGIYLESKGIKTKLVSNGVKIRESNQFFYETLEKYKQVGVFEDRKIETSDISTFPVLINVDWYKITGKFKGQGAHYIVIAEENDVLWLYDGSNYKRKVKTNFQHILDCSRDINRFHEDGMWLVCV